MSERAAARPPRRCCASRRSTPTTGRSTSSRGSSSSVGAGRARLPARRQRLGQVDDAEDDPRPRAAAARARVEFAGEDVTQRPTNYRIRKGMAIVPENRRLFAPMTRAREPEDGRLPARRRRARRLRARLHALPARLRAPRPARRDALGRRAADGRDGPGADVAPEAAADGRAVDGARAAPRRAELRDHQAGQRRGRRGARRRAERERLALDRRPRLRALDRPGRARGARRAS